MANYTITCASGAVVLVSADSAEAAEDAWDLDAAAGHAEERICGTTERASRAAVCQCVDSGHDYR